MKRTPLRRRTPIRKRARRPKRILDPAYLEWVGTLPCIVTGSRPSERHHVRRLGIPGGGSAGVRPDDRRAVPVCRPVHREVQGRDAFWWGWHGIDIEATIRELNERYEAETGRKAA